MESVVAGREEGVGLGVLRPTVWVVLATAGVACALTLLFLGMRSVMGVGGFCAEGGPFEIRQHCPQGIPGIMVGSIWGGMVLAFASVAAAARYRVPSLAALLWPGLFLSLGWNFFEYAFDPPGETSGVIWGWLVCGVVFALMGGIPLLVVLPAVVAHFVRGSGAPGTIPFHAQRVAERARRATGGTAGLVFELEKLGRLRRSGVLDDDEYQSAKRRLLREEEQT